MRFFIASFFSLLAISAWSQQAFLGEWREHVPWGNANSIAMTESNIFYTGAEAGFTRYDPSTNEIKRFTKITGLSDIGVQLLEYGEESGMLIVAYKQGNIDILESNRIINISDIKEDNRTGDKNIYNIRFDGLEAYLSCGFGIVVLNLDKKEIKDTYRPTQSDVKVSDVYIRKDENRIYAATDSGMYYGDLNDNLLDFNSWTRINVPIGQYSLVDYYADRMLFNMKTSKFDSDMVWGFRDGQYWDMTDTLGSQGNVHFQPYDDRLLVCKNYQMLQFDLELNRTNLIYVYAANEEMPATPSEAIYHDDHWWLADQQFGMVEYYYAGESFTHTPNGPNTVSVNHLDISRSTIWTAAGVLDNSYGNSFSRPEFNQYQNLEWNGTDDLADTNLNNKYGYVKIVANPADPEQVFSGSWGAGLTEFRNGKVFMHYDTSNMNTHTLTDARGTGLIKIGGLDFDQLGNLWVSNSEVSYAISKYVVAEDRWQDYYLGNYVSETTVTGDVLVTRNGHKWILVNKENRIIVFDETRTPGDQSRIITSSEGSGNIPGGTIHCIAEDDGGSIWIGTDEGPAVFYSASSVFENIPEAQRIFVQQDGQTQILLETENIRSITLDGANRKWFGTTNSGAYLMSADGTQEVSHFTEDNSNIFSDDIKYIGIDHQTGEVYFCTSEGLVAYRGTATGGTDAFGEVQVYPNPVPQGYGGLIAIKGLAKNANVKITDMNGVLVYETYALGGQATWNGRSLTGNPVKNGVYLIFATNESGESSEVTKIMYLNN